MKLGILTFHYSMNYGSVLQCYALQEIVRMLGYDVEVLDFRSPSHKNCLDNWTLRKLISPLNVFVRRTLWGLGGIGRWRRARSQLRFVRKYLRLSDWTITSWKEKARRLDVDVVIVGSDQVFNANLIHPVHYLMLGVREVKKIVYAASFGMRSIPAGISEEYRCGLQEFSAVSFREKNGVALAKEVGCKANVCADPVLLMSKDMWLSLVGKEKSHRPLLVCYFMSENLLYSTKRFLREFADRNGCRVEVFWNKAVHTSPFRVPFSKVQYRESAGALKFLESMANAKWVLTESYHALLFAVLFGKNIRVLRPSSELRESKFSRISEVVERFVKKGNVYADDCRKGLDSLESADVIEYDTEALDDFKASSIKWLKEALEGCRTNAAQV